MHRLLPATIPCSAVLSASGATTGATALKSATNRASLCHRLHLRRHRRAPWDTHGQTQRLLRPRARVISILFIVKSATGQLPFSAILHRHPLPPALPISTFTDHATTPTVHCSASAGHLLHSSATPGSSSPSSSPAPQPILTSRHLPDHRSPTQQAPLRRRSSSIAPAQRLHPNQAFPATPALFFVSISFTAPCTASPDRSHLLPASPSSPAPTTTCFTILCSVRHSAPPASSLHSNAFIFQHLRRCLDAPIAYGWKNRWVKSDWKKDENMAGDWNYTSGKWNGDPDDKGIHTAEDYRFYAISVEFPEFSNKDKTLVLQFFVEHDQKLDCGGGYVKKFSGETHTHVWTRYLWVHNRKGLR